MTLWADIAGPFQIPVNNAYPYRVIAFRSNDGTYRDKNFPANWAWATQAVADGRLDFFIVYYVWEADGGACVSTHLSMIGTNPHPRCVSMADVESWSGRYTGDHSGDINAGLARLDQYYGDPRRSIGYGNVGDLNNLWRTKNGRKLVVAAYGSNPAYPDKIAHQYTDAGPCAPFGTCDMNSADNTDIPTLMGLLGLNPNLADLNATPLEDDMTPEQAQQLAEVHQALYAKLSDGPGSWDGINVVLGEVYKAVGEIHQAIFAKASDGPGNWDGLAFTLGEVLTKLETIGAPQAVAPTDAQMQALEAALIAGLASAGVTLAPGQATAIAAEVRANLTANPLTAAPFEIK